MTYQSFLSKTSKYLSFTLLTSALSFGAIIYDSGVNALKVTDPTQLGRLSRSGTPSDWSEQKAFPGVLNPTVSYHYETFVIPSSPFPYLQISFTDLTSSGNLFESAYLNAYTPNSTAANRGLDVNYWGDAGFSSAFPPNPDIFQVVVPASSSLVLVVNDTSATGAGIGRSFNFLVEGFYDTQFNDTIPEPATITLSGAGLALATITTYRRKRKQ
ncbi:MAG: hypothetical protein JO185_11145 [Acidobacteriaceae bacterium]|nr:hypothetical protein [Acidobacteriaceae bacterium]